MLKRITHLIILSSIVILSSIALLGLPAVLSGKSTSYLVDPKLEGEAISAALKKLSPDQIKELQKREAESLQRDPLNASALRNLILLSGLGDKKETQEQLALQISKYSKRNTASQLVTINILFSRRRFDDALIEVDALLRARPQTTPIILPSLLALAADKDGSVALANMLKTEPPWRAELMQFAVKNDVEGNIPLGILNALRSAKAAVMPSEVTWLIGALITAKKVEKAYFVWLDFLPPEDLRFVERVFDGGFDREPKNSYFDWTIVPRQNARIAIKFRPGTVSNRGLAIDFFDDKGFFLNVSQYLQIAPGKYDLSFEFMAPNLKTEEGLVWALRCDFATVLGKSPKLQKAGPWQTLSFPFEIPETGCNTQVLRLESASTAVLDTRISGQMFFDTIKILPQGVVVDETPN